MSSTPPPIETTQPTTTAPTSTQPRINEVKLISHSSLFYWWPVWLLAFFMAIWTFFENNRLAVVPPNCTVVLEAAGEYKLKFPGRSTRSLDDAARVATSDEPAFPTRISETPWLGALFVIGLIITILITNVPLRGLWSFLMIIMIIVVALTISLLGAWDEIFKQLGNLHIYINMAGYLFIGTAVFIMWALATLIFDRRSYIIFTPGQIRYCEHIGDSVHAYSTVGVSMEKQRDDLFRHYILGFGSGDLIVRVGAGADRREIRLPNVLFIGWRLKYVEDMLRQVATMNTQ